MTQEEKYLLLQDISTGISHKVQVLVDTYKIFDGGIIGQVVGMKYVKEELLFYVSGCLTPLTIEEIRPYLRPMSIMTEEEKKEFCKIEERLNFPCKHIKLTFSVDEFDWLNAHHFDYRGLIEKGLALEALEGMYDIKKK